MIAGKLMRGFDAQRLRVLLAALFLALAVPTGILIWHAYSQLKWEAFHQYRGLAETMAARVDAGLIEMIDAADASSFADYGFLVLTGDPQANFVQRSPLSAYPISGGLPGTIGYFQVGADGEFSTPLLPQSGTAPQKVGIGAGELTERVDLALRIQEILGDNRLVRPRPVPDSTAGREVDQPEPEQAIVVRRTAVPAEDVPFADEEMAESEETYSQQVFDELAAAGAPLPETVAGSSADADDQAPRAQARARLGKVADLKLDSGYEVKRADAEASSGESERQAANAPAAPGRSKRKEEIAVAEIAEIRQYAGVAGPSDLRISTFESEIDPMEFSLLDSGHAVLFRKVWRDDVRYIQGVLLDGDVFIRGVVDPHFRGTPLPAMSNLIVAYQDDVIHTIGGRTASRYRSTAAELQGALLYRSRLTAPLDRLELIVSVNSLPPGPGATVIGWVTLVLAMVFTGGFYALYRLGLGQINLARQQQDFVSAVSHELKTPLTSIRMYGEMLKEGWASEEKRQGYYEYIHDESERLTRLIANVLQLARITRNEPQFEMKPVRVSELVSQIDSKIANQVERAGFELTIDAADRALESTVDIDEDCFAQIVINLVDNAIKFSGQADRQRIDIGCTLTGDGDVVFSVRDFGPGIPRDQLRKIFRLFYRSGSELTRETVGTGIGLAIVHQLSVAMDGRVDVVNRDPGAEFRISFPAIKA